MFGWSSPAECRHLTRPARTGDQGHTTDLSRGLGVFRCRAAARCLSAPVPACRSGRPERCPVADPVRRPDLAGQPRLGDANRAERRRLRQQARASRFVDLRSTRRRDPSRRTTTSHVGTDGANPVPPGRRDIAPQARQHRAGTAGREAPSRRGDRSPT